VSLSRAAVISAADRRLSFIIQFLHWLPKAAMVFEIAATKAATIGLSLRPPNLGEDFSIPAENKNLDICIDLLN
jgi:hypothetical protein